jgi:uncharacterized protein YaaQ
MKLIIAIIRDTDNEQVSQSLNNANFRVTCIASTGGFWRHGQNTLLIGIEDDQLDVALKIIRENVTRPTETDSHHTTIFVLKIDHFSQF